MTKSMECDNYLTASTSFTASGTGERVILVARDSTGRWWWVPMFSFTFCGERYFSCEWRTVERR